MPAVVCDNKERSNIGYELILVSNCKNLNDIKFSNNIPVYYFVLNDIELKFNTDANDNVIKFNSLIDEFIKYDKKAIFIRKSDLSMATYPDIILNNNSDIGIEAIKQYLSLSYNVDGDVISYNYNTYNQYTSLKTIKPNISISEEIKCNANFENKIYTFYIHIAYLMNDTWKVYYIIGKKGNVLKNIKDKDVDIRIDSGCVSGQIYKDESCDCLDQFYSFFDKIGDEGVVIHIPTQDGRGFGFAPKAETEIYKLGGVGKINTTEAMDTVSAAKLLYKVQDNSYDIRDYNGAVKIIQLLQCKSVRLFSDNRKKIQALEDAGITVKRTPTETNKSTCIHHIQSKKNDNTLYFK